MRHHGDMSFVPPSFSAAARWSVMPFVAPTVAAAAGLSAAVFVRLGGSVPFLRCPLHEMTGLWCPGCGLTRGAARLVTGDIAGAMAYNVFTPVVVLAIATAWWTWWWPTVAPSRSNGIRRLVLPTRATPWVIGALLVFTVARNLPWAPFAALAP
jgi:Protein of unknown function (DUF2752)